MSVLFNLTTIDGQYAPFSEIYPDFPLNESQMQIKMTKKEFECFPNENRSQTSPSPFIGKNLIQNLFEETYKTTLIFSASIVPSKPNISQTWYLKKSYQPMPVGYYPESSSISLATSDTSEDPAISAVSFDKLKKFNGFLKPFETFISSHYQPDARFDNCSPIFLDSENAVENQVKSIQSENLQSGLRKILTLFLRCPEIEQLGMIYFQPNQIIYSIFTKPIKYF